MLGNGKGERSRLEVRVLEESRRYEEEEEEEPKVVLWDFSFSRNGFLLRLWSRLRQSSRPSSRLAKSGGYDLYSREDTCRWVEHVRVDDENMQSYEVGPVEVVEQTE